jgi:V/A-type H+/Na+-transporting ATPase subunit D
MRVRHPPGRAGRLWLQHRVEVATSGAELLDKKRRALQQELRRLQVLVRETQEAWTEAAVEAEAWVTRAAVMAGEEQLRTLAATQARATVAVQWRSSMGVVYAAETRIDLGSVPSPAVGGSAATDAALPAARRAVEAAVRNAAAQSALKRIGGELAITSRRHRALERRWLPALTAAAARLDERLDELEREETIRSAWAGRSAGRR